MRKRPRRRPRKASTAQPEPEAPAHKVRLPGFIADDDEIGLGDVIKRTTSYLGIKPCGGCNRRAAALNRWMKFTK